MPKFNYKKAEDDLYDPGACHPDEIDYDYDHVHGCEFGGNKGSGSKD